MRQTLVCQVIITLLLLGLSPLAYPSQTELKSLEQMAQAAQNIVQGRVADANAARDAKGRIWTIYTIVIQEKLKLIFDSAISEPLPFQYSTNQKKV